MSLERWFRSDDVVSAFDWSRPARDLDVPLDVARALYVRAMRLALDAARAEALYLRWLRAAAEARRAFVPGRAAVPGRHTRVMHEARTAASARDLRARDDVAPGRWTRALLEASPDETALPGFDDVQRALGTLTAGGERDRSVDPGASSRWDARGCATDRPATDGASTGASTVDALRERLVAAASDGRSVRTVLASADPATAAAALRQLRSVYAPGGTVPVLRLVTQAADGEVERVIEQAGERAGRTSAGAALPADLAARLGPHVGADAAGAARLHTDDAADLIAAAHHARALTLGKDIFFARGEYAPGTPRGDELLAHELTHVAQGQRGELARAAAKGVDTGGPLDAAEVEADLRARFAALQLHPPEGAMPELAAPSGQPLSEGDRTARLAAQQERITLADQATVPLTVPAAPPTISPQTPAEHPPPTMTVAPVPADTGNAYVDTFQAPPSKQALELWAKAGTEATTEAAADQAAFDATLPEVPVVLEGCETPAEGGGGTAPGEQPAGDAAPDGAVPPSATVPPAEQPTAEQLALQSIATLSAMFPPSTDENRTQAQTAGLQALDALPTTAPDVNTNPGTAPVTDLAGQADPVRTLGDHQQAIADSATALDDAKTQIITGPGAAQIQPIKLDEKLTVPREQAIGAMPALPPVDGMDKFKKWNLPANAMAAFDDVARPRMDASLAESQAKMTLAETQRDADRARAVTDAQDKVKQAHTDADKQQQAKVAETRTRIANQQADTLLKQENEVKKLDEQSGDRKKGTISRINERIAADQTKVDTDYKDAQRRADERRQQGEADAARKKQEAQDRAANQSWWDQIVGAICDAIQAIADEINQVLEDIGTAIGQILDDVKNAACQLIDAARDFVCQALTEFGDWLKSAVTALIGSVFPELAAALNALIDQAINDAKAAVNAIADGLKTAVTALCDGLKAAVDAVIATFKAAVEAAATFAQALVSGDWALVGKMFLDGILNLLGIDPAAFYALIGEAEDSIEKIIENPGAFVGHLIDAVKLGFQQFGDNFWTHLQAGMMEWLFGTLGEAGLVMPASFDLAGIFDLVCQVLGLTWPRLREKVVGIIGEDNTERLEFVAQYIEALITGGFAGLWEKIQQDLSNLWEMVIGGIRDWLVQTVVQQAILKIATMWNPVGAIIQLIQTAWNVYQWVRENAQRIFGLVEAVVHSISNIVAGDISGAANFVESSLAQLVPVAISLFANLIGLGGLSGEIRRVIENVQEALDNAINSLIERVKAMFRGNDNDAGDEGEDGEEQEVPRSLAEPQPAEIDEPNDTLSAQLGQAEPGQVIYQAGTSDPKEVTEQLLAAHPDARFDTTTGQLTLPPLDAAALSGATSLQQLGQLAAQQTGVSKVTITESDTTITLRGHINPDTVIATIDKLRNIPTAQLLQMLERIANDFWDSRYNLNGPDPAQNNQNLAANDQAMAAMTGGGTHAAVPAVPEDDLHLAANQAEPTQQQFVFHPLAPSPNQPASGVTTVQSDDRYRLTDTDPRRGNLKLNYDAIVARLAAHQHGPEDIAAALDAMRNGRGIPLDFSAEDANDLALLRDLLFNVEIQRDPRNLLFSGMAVELMANGTSTESVLGRRQGLHPATMPYAAEGFETKNTRPGSRRNVAQAESRRRQVELLLTWFEAQLRSDEALQASFAGENATLENLETFVREWVVAHWTAAANQTGQDAANPAGDNTGEG